MTAAAPGWRIRLTETAEADFRGILRWTEDRFGMMQAREYVQTLSLAMAALTAGPTLAGVKGRADIQKGLFALHIARDGRRGWHFVMFRVGADKEPHSIEILRLLHDAMDLPQHLPGPD